MYKVKYFLENDSGFVFALPRADFEALDEEDQEAANETEFSTDDFFYAQTYALELAKEYPMAKYAIIFTGKLH